MVQPVCAMGTGRQPWAGLHPLQQQEFLRDVLELLHSVLRSWDLSCHSKRAGCLGQLMQWGVSMAVYLLPP